MTRIISGIARSRTLEVPKAGTRPTSDRVRESLFSSLEHVLGAWFGVRVLDLYAGSGALVLEALSRGAASGEAVDQSAAACEVIRRNARTTGLPVMVTRASVDTWLANRRSGDPAIANQAPLSELPSSQSPASHLAEGRSRANQPLDDRQFDLVFIDPPYDLSAPDIDRVVAALASGGVLADGAVVCVERDNNSPEVLFPSGFDVVVRRRYGGTAVTRAIWSPTDSPVVAESDQA